MQKKYVVFIQLLSVLILYFVDFFSHKYYTGLILCETSVVFAFIIFYSCSIRMSVAAISFGI